MNIISCPVCFGNGFVIARKDNYDFKYHCRCRHGESHKYEGRDCTKYATNYFCASIDTLPSGTIDEIIKDNCKRHGMQKVGDRWMKPTEPQLSPDQIKDLKAMAYEMMKIRI